MNMWKKIQWGETQWGIGTAVLVVALALYMVGALSRPVTKKATVPPPPLPPILAPWLERPQLEVMVSSRFSFMYPAYTKTVFDAVEVEARSRDLPPQLLLAVVEVESGFDFKVVSDKGCIGLTQVNPSAWEAKLKSESIIRERRDLYDPARNIAAGAYILQHYLQESNWGAERALYRYFGANDKVYAPKVLALVGRYGVESYKRRKA